MERMRRVLAPLGIYDLEDGSLIAAELYAYAAGLAWLEECMEHTLAGLFVATADARQLRRFERMLSLPSDGTLTQRRERVYSRLSRLRGTWSRQAYLDTLTADGFSGTVTERHADGTLVLGFGEQAQPEHIRQVMGGAYRLLPAHLRLTTDLPVRTWDAYDAMRMTFAGWDEMAMCWDAHDVPDV